MQHCLDMLAVPCCMTTQRISWCQTASVLELFLLVQPHSTTPAGLSCAVSGSTQGQCNEPRPCFLPHCMHRRPACARLCAVSVWKTTSRLDKSSNKDGHPTFNCLLLQFGVVAQGVQELADLMHEVEHQPASTILQVFSLPTSSLSRLLLYHVCAWPLRICMLEIMGK